ncbi:hypothetical protein LJR219_002744 [Phenylobacterium sp. LjRoot219]|uniref:DUF7662 domain-containing protein n=1 Tax=Phenylobacterium sp. LjRoot219 TaxID=3342283 RepID=UPI003ECD256F
MSKYNPLADRLAAHTGDEWGASFSELEAVLGFALPKAAQSGRGWWGNDPDKSHSRAWAAQGWVVGDVDHATQRVVFRRGAGSGVILTQAAGLKPQPAPASPPAAAEIQPPVLREAAEAASAKMHRNRALGGTAIVTAGVAVLAGLGAMVMRGVLRRRSK